tara:strand:- start:80 stop:337 length:258 start_codon:yes stop_codon:yes gene_type:complete
MKIEKNVEPPEYNSYNNKFESIAKKMEIGDSVFFDFKEDNVFPVSDAQKLFNRIKKIYGKGSARTARINPNSGSERLGIRVWRIK